MAQPFTTVSDLMVALRAIGDHSRPAFDPEIIGCLNFGYKEVIRSVSAVRSELLASYVNNVTFPANTAEIDVSMLDPPMMRPVRLLIPSGRAILFRYMALHHQDYEAAELGQGRGTANVLLYDILQGRFPGVTTTVVGSVPPGEVQLADATNFPVGTYVTMALPSRTILVGFPGTPQPPGFDPYYGLIASRAGTGPGAFVTFNPPIPSGVTLPVGQVVTVLRREIIRIANPPTQSQTGQLWYQYRPKRLVNYDEIIDPVIAEYQDMLLYYALSQYLSAVNDNEANGWLQKAQLLKSELMQDLEPLSGQNSEALDSGLWGLG